MTLDQPADEEFKWVVSVDSHQGLITKYWKGPLWKGTLGWTEDIDDGIAVFATHRAAERAWTETFPNVSKNLPIIHTLRATRKRAEVDIAPVMARDRTGLAAAPHQGSPFPAAQSARDRRKERREGAARHLDGSFSAQVDERSRRRREILGVLHEDEDDYEFDDWRAYYEDQFDARESHDTSGGFSNLIRRAGSWVSSTYARPRFSKERVHEIFNEVFDGYDFQPASAKETDGEDPQRSE